MLTTSILKGMNSLRLEKMKLPVLFTCLVITLLLVPKAVSFSPRAIVLRPASTIIKYTSKALLGDLVLYAALTDNTLQAGNAARSDETIHYDDSDTFDFNQNRKQTWLDQAQQVVDYRDKYGHTLVPKRFKENPSLGNWVNKQRQQYRRYNEGKTPCSLTEKRIQLLNKIGFCWDATSLQSGSSKDDIHESISLERVHKNRHDAWWRRLDEIKALVVDGSLTSLDRIESQSSLGHWMNKQRKEYRRCKDGQPSSTLDSDKMEALGLIDSEWWKGVRQRQWDTRFQELLDYRKRHGDCCVPISNRNQKLANWVSNQRRKYTLKMAGQSSELTDEQMEQLNAVGFVWNRWEYEFEKKGMDLRSLTLFE
jgi:hypothetical protein